MKKPNTSVISSSKLKKDIQYNGQTTIYKTLHRKLKIDQHEPHKKTVLNSGAPEGLSVSVPWLIDWFIYCV